MCCNVLLKSLMFICNGTIFLAGVGLLGVGIWLKVDEGSLTELLGSVDGDVANGLEQLSNISYVLIGVGAVLLVIGFLGCCGAIQENRCMLMTFFIILLIILIAEVATAALMFVFEAEAEVFLETLKEEVAKTLTELYKNETLPDIWTQTMDEFKCCGFSNYTDFGYGPRYPDQCCNSNFNFTGHCSATVAAFSDVPGCLDFFLDYILDNAMTVIGVAVGVIAIEIAAMVVSMVLYKDIGRKHG